MNNPYQALLNISKEINSVRETGVLLDRVLDIAMEVLQAERGFILVRGIDGGERFEAVSARNISKETISSIQELSTSVVNRVLDSAEPVVAVDARADQRFSEAESILLQQIRSVICTPLLRETEIVGAIYMDSRMDSGSFDRESLKFLQAFAEQAAVSMENARQFELLHHENQRLRRHISLTSIFPEIIGKSKAVLDILEMIRDVADSSATVLIEGESGTGKELVARALHGLSTRADNLFIPIFCGSLTESLLESELFGHKRGSFTGATEDKAGLFEEADGGTLLLDEVADVSKNVQTRLLRTIQEGEIKRVGESHLRRVDVRIISATNKDLWREVQDGHFREDLFYRLNVINIKMPPLRERKGDVPLLAEHFLAHYVPRNGKHITGFTNEAMQALEAYSWPGNIRELQNTIERAVILCRSDRIGIELINLHRSVSEETIIGNTLREIEYHVIRETLKLAENNKTRTAEILGVSRRWLQYRLKEMDEPE